MIYLMISVTYILRSFLYGEKAPGGTDFIPFSSKRLDIETKNSGHNWSFICCKYIFSYFPYNFLPLFQIAIYTTFPRSLFIHNV